MKDAKIISCPKIIKILFNLSLPFIILSVSLGFTEEKWLSFRDGSVTRSTEAASIRCSDVRIDQTGANPQCKVTLSFPGATLTFPDDNGLLAGKYAVLRFKPQDMKLMGYTINGSIRPEMQGMPNVPFARFKVRIPRSVSKVSVEVVNTAFKAVEGGYTIAPVQEDLPESFYYGIDYDHRTFQINNQVYSRAAYYTSPVEYEIAICHGMKILEVRYSPVQFNPVLKKLLVTNKAQIVIKYLDGNMNEPGTPNLFGRVITRTTYDGIAGKIKQDNAVKPVRGGKVVVVSQPSLTGTSTYSDWKSYREAQGYEFIEEINSTGMSASAITNELESIYNSQQMDFVIVLGDETINPIPTDGNYYHYKDWARLDGSDNVEDVCLGIFLCDNEERFGNIVQHQKWHEEGGPWTNTILMAAGMEDDGTTWDRFSSGHYSSIYLDDPGGGLGYEVKRVYKVPRIPTRYGGSYCNIPYNDFEEWTLDPDPFFTGSSDATQKIYEYWNDGYAIMGHRDHGSNGGTGSPSMRYSMFNGSITSEVSPFFTCLNCLTGNFKGRHSSNFAYQAQSRTYGTSVIISATRTTYSGDNDYFHLGMWEGIFPKDGSLGERNIGHIWLTGHLSARDHAKTYFHVFGDPMTELSIGDMEPFINVSDPNGGEQVEQGSTYTISWGDNIDGNVKIELLKGGSVNSTIVSSTVSDGQHEWQVPGDQVVASDYKIRITSIDSSALFDESNDNFSVIGEYIILCPYFQPFDTLESEKTDLPEKWEQLTTDNLDWTVLSGPTPSRVGSDPDKTGPDGDHTTGNDNYLYVEASSDNSPDKTADFVTPKFNFKNMSSPKLTFWVHMFSADNTMGDLNLDISVDGTWNDDVVRLTDDHGDQWFEESVDLNQYKGDRVIFRFRATTGSDWCSDICIDDFKIDGSVPINPTVTRLPSSFDLRIRGSRLCFQVPDNGAKSSPISIKLYNIKGKLVSTLVNGTVNAGYHSLLLDKMAHNGQKLAAGMYLCRMETSGFTRTINLLMK